MFDIACAITCIQDVSPRAIRMSVRQIIKSKHIICSVPNARKAIAIKNTLEQEVSNLYPASILRTHHHCAIYLDKDAAGMLDHATKETICVSNS